MFYPFVLKLFGMLKNEFLKQNALLGLSIWF